MRYRYTKWIQLILAGVFFLSFLAGDVYSGAKPISHLPWLFPAIGILSGAALILIDRTNKCPSCRKDLGYSHKGVCPHCKEQLF